MKYFDQIPNIQKDCPFPIGDIPKSHDSAVDDWLESAHAMPHYAFMQHIENNSNPSPKNKTEIAAYGLCHRWDYSYNNGQRYTSMGIRVATAFNRLTQYLPPVEIDLSRELEQMTQGEAMGGRINSGRIFGRIAWNSLALYPNAHWTLLRLLEFTEPRYNIVSSKDQDCLKTGLILPFMLSWTSGLVTATPEFTCFSDDQDNEDFINRFSNIVPLAADPEY